MTLSVVLPPVPVLPALDVYVLLDEQLGIRAPSELDAPHSELVGLRPAVVAHVSQPFHPPPIDVLIPPAQPAFVFPLE